jgi:RNA recognition motif-containing protein
VTPDGVSVRDGVCFVEFPSQEMASIARASLTDAEWAGKHLHVHWATSKYVKRFMNRRFE